MPGLYPIIGSRVYHGSLGHGMRDLTSIPGFMQPSAFCQMAKSV